MIGTIKLQKDYQSFARIQNWDVLICQNIHTGKGWVPGGGEILNLVYFFAIFMEY